jgi:serine phosphatase RsbU (regulator of sigma subunit)
VNRFGRDPLFSAFIDTEGSEIVYTAAGHEPPTILRGDGRVDSPFNTQLIVGIDERQTYT